MSTVHRWSGRPILLTCAPVAPLPALTHYTKHGVAATAALVPIRARRPTIALPASQHLPHARQAGYDLLSEATENNLAACAAALDLHTLGLPAARRKQVMDRLVVYLKVAAA